MNKNILNKLSNRVTKLLKLTDFPFPFSEANAELKNNAFSHPHNKNAQELKMHIFS